MAVCLIVKKNNGATERVSVEFPSHAIKNLAEAGADFDRMAELFCDRPKGWAESLAEDSRGKLFSVMIEAQLAWHAHYERFVTAWLAKIKEVAGPLDQIKKTFGL